MADSTKPEKPNRTRNTQSELTPFAAAERIVALRSTQEQRIDAATGAIREGDATAAQKILARVPEAQRAQALHLVASWERAPEPAVSEIPAKFFEPPKGAPPQVVEHSESRARAR